MVQIAQATSNKVLPAAQIDFTRRKFYFSRACEQQLRPQPAPRLCSPTGYIGTVFSGPSAHWSRNSVLALFTHVVSRPFLLQGHRPAPGDRKGHAVPPSRRGPGPWG